MPAVSFAVAPIEGIKNQSHTSSDLRTPLPTLRSKSAYYHPNYHPADSPNADLVLASSDKISCWFAISRAQLFCHDDAFRSVGLELITPDSNLPLVKLGESRAVIEVILSCLQADTIPDFGHLDFRVLSSVQSISASESSLTSTHHQLTLTFAFLFLVSALEAAADKYRLVHMEKICLLAMGLVSKYTFSSLRRRRELIWCVSMQSLLSDPSGRSLYPRLTLLVSLADRSRLRKHPLARHQSVQVPGHPEQREPFSPRKNFLSLDYMYTQTTMFK
jgi:hypothetical protein